MHIVFRSLFLVSVLHAIQLFAVRFNAEIQLLPDGTHRAQQKDGTIARFQIDNGVSSTADVLWRLPSPHPQFTTGAGSVINATVAELVHGECSEIDVPVTSVVDIAVGTKHACVLRQNGDILCWGDNSYCQLGPNTPPGVFTTKAVVVIQSGTYLKLDVFGTVTCASSAAGGMCWGAVRPIKARCSDRVYTYSMPELGYLRRLKYALVIVSSNALIETTILGGTLYNGRVATSEPAILNEPCAVCSISESFVECSNIHGFYVGNVSPLLSKPYSESLNLDGPILFGLPGCGYRLVTDDGLELKADAAISREYRTRHGCLRILSCANVLPTSTPLLNNVITLVSGISHVCFLDSVGDVYCRGDNSECQFISANHTFSAWSRVNIPLKATNLFASGNVTCVTDQDNVFCTGCILTGCICKPSITFKRNNELTITNTGVCVSSACIGTRGIPDSAAPLCTTNEHSIVCDGIGYAATVLAFAASKNGIVVFTTRDGLLCVSDNMLRSVLCN